MSRQRKVVIKALDFLDLYYIYTSIVGKNVRKNTVTLNRKFPTDIKNKEFFSRYVILLLDLGRQIEQVFQDILDRNRCNLYRVNKYLKTKYSKEQISNWNIEFMSEKDLQKVKVELGCILVGIKVHLHELDLGEAFKDFSFLASSEPEDPQD